jgi:hypothetical protein
LPALRLLVTRLRVDNDELEPAITSANLEVVREDRGSGPGQGLLTWNLTVVTDERWHHGLGQCQLYIDVAGDRRFRGHGVLIRSDGGRWHYFQGSGPLDGLDGSELDSEARHVNESANAVQGSTKGFRNA